MEGGAPPTRVLIAKLGLDGHDRGVRLVARALRDHGHEVIYTGLHASPEQVVAAAVQEGVDAVGLSSLAGAHDALFTEVLDGLRAADADDVVVFAGGIIPDDDARVLRERGVRAVFGPGTPLSEIADWLAEELSSSPRHDRPASDDSAPI